MVDSIFRSIMSVSSASATPSAMLRWCNVSWKLTRRSGDRTKTRNEETNFGPAKIFSVMAMGGTAMSKPTNRLPRKDFESPCIFVSLFLLLFCLPRVSVADVTALTGATLHPIVEAPIENGVLVIRDGQIAALGTDINIP